MNVEMVLAGVTLVSLALATSLAAVAWKLIRDHRRFAAARVDALVALATGDEVHEAGSPSTPSLPVEPIDLPAPALDTSTETPLEIPFAADTVVAPMFATASASGVNRRRNLALATVGLAMATAAAAFYAVHSSGAAFISTVLRAASSADTSDVPPLELRALRHTIDEAGTFVVSGVVVDPPGGRTFENVVAVVYLFDEDGRCFANSRGSIDVTTLRAGDQSGFEVRVNATTPVSRYRVGFRRADGGTVTHVDKRQGSGGT